MDNITHTVLGLVAGDGVHHLTNPRVMPSDERRRLFLWSAVLGSNVCDLDVLYNYFSHEPVQTLLQHRGYTHTLIMILPQAVLVMGILFLLLRKLFTKRLKLEDWVWAGVATVIAIGLHIFADSWNIYGVHPFYPFNNNWYYGDFVFIVEPLIWVACGAWIVLELSLFWRLLYFALFSFVIGLGFHFGGINLNQIIVLFTLVSATSLLMGLLASSRRSFLALILLGALLSMLSYQGHQVRRLVAEAYRASNRPDFQDLAVSPLPMNPFCWTAMGATVEQGNFVVRKANVDLWPKRIPQESCRLFNEESKPVHDVKNTNQLEWYREDSTSLAVFRAYSADCYFRDWLRFARLPQIQNGHAVDVRFSNRRARNFTDLPLKLGRTCLPDIPPWNPPRAALLRESL